MLKHQIEYKMKVKSVVLFFLFIANCFLTVTAQIVLEPTDLPKIGAIQISIKVDATQSATLPAGSKGENIVWDFSNLVACCGIPRSQDTVLWLDRKVADAGNYFIGAELALNKKCIKIHSHVTHLDELICNHNFYSKDNQGLKLYGYDYPYNTISEQFQLVFPLLTYGEKLVNKSRTVFNISSDSTRILAVIDTLSADAWGTLKTPAGTSAAIRIYNTETVLDSLFINDVFQFVKTSNGYAYKWYSKGVGFPVMQITGVSLSTNSLNRTVMYSKSSSIVLGINESDISVDFVKVYPNPTKQVTTFHFDKIDANDPYTLSITDLTGKQWLQINEIRSTDLVIPRGNITDGLYIYKISNKRGIITYGKLIYLKE